MSETDGDGQEWVTVGEAAARLGTDAKQVRRYMLRLDAKDVATDPQRTHKGQPVAIVRWVPLVALVRPETQGAEAKDSNGQVSDTAEGTQGAASDADLLRRAEVAEAENALLRETLAHDRERWEEDRVTMRAAVMALRDLEHKAAARLGAAFQAGAHATLAALEAEATDTATDTPAVPSDRVGSPHSGDTSPRDTSAGGEQEKPPRKWWQVWR